MTEFITLTCPSCGGKLQITSSIEQFACGHCGNEHIVKREGGAVYLAPVIETLQNIKYGTDKTASELAISRIKTEIIEIEKLKIELVDLITKVFNDPQKYKDIKKLLASRRNSPFERLAFQKSATPTICIHEIQTLPPEEFNRYKNNVTMNMIRINLETLANFEKTLQDKRNQLSQHKKVVDGK